MVAVKQRIVVQRREAWALASGAAKEGEAEARRVGIRGQVLVLGWIATLGWLAAGLPGAPQQQCRVPGPPQACACTWAHR
jgi:hypothetical protein